MSAAAWIAVFGGVVAGLGVFVWPLVPRPQQRHRAHKSGNAQFLLDGHQYLLDGHGFIVGCIDRDGNARDYFRGEP